MSGHGNGARRQVHRAREQAAARGPGPGPGHRLDGVQLPALRDAAYGLIGWLIGRAVHVSLLFPVGMLVGLAISIGFIIYRYGGQGAGSGPRPRKHKRR